MDTQHLPSVIEVSDGKAVAEPRVLEVVGPHVEHATGEIVTVIDGQNPAGPVIEHAGAVPDGTGDSSPVTDIDKRASAAITTHPLPSASDLDKIQGEQVIKAATKGPFNLKEYLQTLSLSPDAQADLSLLFDKAEKLDKLEANPIVNAFLAAALKMM